MCICVRALCKQAYTYIICLHMYLRNVHKSRYTVDKVHKKLYAILLKTILKFPYFTLDIHSKTS